MICCLAVVGACLSPSLASAGDAKSKEAAASSAKKKTPKETKVIITGSNIPQKIDPSQRILKTASPVVVITQQDIQRSGRVTVAGILSRHPSFR